MKETIFELSSVVIFISKVKRKLVNFKNKRKQTYLAYLDVIRTSPSYKKPGVYKKLKPYIEGIKNIEDLKKESFIEKESDTSDSKKKKFLSREVIVEKNMLYMICKGDKGVFENTYGYPTRYH